MTLQELRTRAKEASQGVTQYYVELYGTTILALIAVIEAADSMRASLLVNRDDVTVQPYDAVRERLEEILK
jgi:hypothetical protein